ncbi:MAG: hypothetical protein MGF17_16935 [Trichodesmium sp. MAG_R04]|nr:hypothetical protein [Trichodesmium sp. MAG_R04]
MKFRLRISRPELQLSANPAEQEKWKKLSHRFELFKAEYSETTVELWAMDEQRFTYPP